MDQVVDPVDSMFAEAAAELAAQRVADAKVRIKTKLKALIAAKQVVTNLEAEIADLKLELKETL